MVKFIQTRFSVFYFKKMEFKKIYWIWKNYRITYDENIRLLRSSVAFSSAVSWSLSSISDNCSIKLIKLPEYAAILLSCNQFFYSSWKLFVSNSNNAKLFLFIPYNCTKASDHLGSQRYNEFECISIWNSYKNDHRTIL